MNISAPITAPTQKPRNSFPAWRLPNGTINATEAQLEGASSSCERWEWGCAGFVAAAVFAEVFLAIWPFPYASLWERIDTSVIDGAIAFGIVGEVIFSRKDSRIQTELRRRSNKRVEDAEKILAEAVKSAAEANERAALATAELQKLKSPRCLNDAIFQKEIADKPKWPIVEFLFVDASDCRSFSMDIAITLTQAGWSVALPKPLLEPNAAAEFLAFRTPIESWGARATGVSIVARKIEDDSPQKALMWALAKAGSEMHAHGGRDSSMKEGSLRIVVAPRM